MTISHSQNPRMGPRPLPLHVATAAMTWLGSRAVLPISKHASWPWKKEVAEAAAELVRDLEKIDAEAFTAAVDRETRRRFDGFAAGILAYRRHPYRRTLDDPPAIWSEGTTRLLDYGGPTAADAPPVLVIPSLINRAYIVDLSEQRSLLRFLAAAGLRPFLVDWGKPGSVERNFSLTDYVAGRLESALDAVLDATGRPVQVIGYCMGGLLALALAHRRRRDIASLALLATPWDFHVDRQNTGATLSRAMQPILPWLESIGELPVDLIQVLFFGLDPYMVIRKFLNFGTLDPASSRAIEFVALEDWLNDGVGLATGVARECLVGWYGANTPGRGEWRVAGRPVLPQTLALPALVVVPQQDRIVLPASSEVLAQTLPQAQRLLPPLGHIGMVVGRRAEEELWRPLLEWLRTYATGGLVSNGPAAYKKARVRSLRPAKVGARPKGHTK